VNRPRLLFFASFVVSSFAFAAFACGGAPSEEAGAGYDGPTSTAGGSFDGSVSDVPVPADKFSFFVTSLRGLQDLSGSSVGFGGDLRFGETGPGAGLRGADKICATLAERSLPGAGNKGWRAFLSAAAGEDGLPVNAIDRIGEGPYYDRLGRLVAPTKADLLQQRPTNGDPAIRDDLPNEDGVPNHQPDPTAGAVDNHHMLTGSNTAGKIYALDATCLSWTSAKGDTSSEGKPRVGLSWPRNGGAQGAHWISAMSESGCKPGVNLVETGGPQASAANVGSGGGYGGFYCFALSP
jgi:hypothetical protein